MPVVQPGYLSGTYPHLNYLTFQLPIALQVLSSHQHNACGFFG
jgi:hypothetical protein